MSKKHIVLAALGAFLILGVLYNQYSIKQEMSAEITDMQEKFDDQETSISTVVRVLDEIREEKKAAEQKAREFQDSLHQTRIEAQQLTDSLIHVNNTLKHEINREKRNTEHNTISPLEQRYRSTKSGDPGEK